jgi:hypothetical protein
MVLFCFSYIWLEYGLGLACFNIRQLDAGSLCCICYIQLALFGVLFIYDWCDFWSKFLGFDLLCSGLVRFGNFGLVKSALVALGLFWVWPDLVQYGLLHIYMV